MRVTVTSIVSLWMVSDMGSERFVRVREVMSVRGDRRDGAGRRDGNKWLVENI
jgi:hypothetical protein